MTNSLSIKLKKFRYKWSPRQTFADLFAKTWMDPFVPFVIMLGILVFFAISIQGFASLYGVNNLGRGFAELGLISLAMGLSLMAGGIDLSVGSMVAIIDFIALYCFNVLGWPIVAVVIICCVSGGLLGAVNGYFVGYLRTRPFLTTLVTLLVYRGIYNLLAVQESAAIATSTRESNIWDWLGNGTFIGLPSSMWVLIIIGIIGHILLTRSRIGWHLIAVGASRRSARHAGIGIVKVLFWTYVWSGILCAIGALLLAARLNSAGSEVGYGYEFETLAAVMIGGVSLSGGKGSVGRAVIGTAIVYVLANGLVQMGFPGALTIGINGAILLLAICIDSKWTQNKNKAVQKSFVNPTYVDFGVLPETKRGSKSPYAMNDRLSAAEPIALDQIEGPEDIILDREGRLYAGTRQGWILRFSGERFEKRELFAKTGGRPLGLAFDRDDNLIVCVCGMGLYGVKPDGTIFKITDETNRSWGLVDDTRLKLTDDLDIAPDGKIYFSEGTVRFNLDNWPVDGVEGRGSGRLVCYDPKTNRTRTVIRNLLFCNGVCITHDNKAVLFAETFANRLSRYWIEGPKKGQIEILIENLPGAPDNINRASDGGYWLALVAMRAPVYDVAMRHPGFRMRMIKQLPTDEWLIQGMNNGCIVKLDGECNPVSSYWDPGGNSHATLTSMREDRGYLYLGGLENNRIGRIPLDGVDTDWISSESYWGKHGETAPVKGN